ncbi:MAG: VWA domain-containing protein [Candidatus Izemoplasmatales bacterium]|nr:VWA domain-containing protein [Candidatus Izemoplasmatales bacterium]
MSSNTFNYRSVYTDNFYLDLFEMFRELYFRSFKKQVYGLDSGELDIDAFIDLKYNHSYDYEIFKDEVHKNFKTESDVFILVDGSYSMQSVFRFVWRSACSLATALHTAGYNVELAVLNNSLVSVIKSYGKPINEYNFDRASCMSGSDEVTNITNMCKRIITQPSKNKLGIVITDGQQAYDNYITRTIRFWESKGIKLVGLGIGSNAVSQQYSDYHYYLTNDALLKNLGSDIKGVIEKYFEEEV